MRGLTTQAQRPGALNQEKINNAMEQPTTQTPGSLQRMVRRMVSKAITVSWFCNVGRPSTKEERSWLRRSLRVWSRGRLPPLKSRYQRWSKENLTPTRTTRKDPANPIQNSAEIQSQKKPQGQESKKQNSIPQECGTYSVPCSVITELRRQSTLLKEHLQMFLLAKEWEPYANPPNDPSSATRREGDNK